MAREEHEGAIMPDLTTLAASALLLAAAAFVAYGWAVALLLAMPV